jgi:hypothetical protein
MRYQQPSLAQSLRSVAAAVLGTITLLAGLKPALNVVRYDLNPFAGNGAKTSHKAERNSRASPKDHPARPSGNGVSVQMPSLSYQSNGSDVSVHTPSLSYQSNGSDVSVHTPSLSYQSNGSDVSVRTPSLSYQSNGSGVSVDTSDGN